MKASKGNKSVPSLSQDRDIPNLRGIFPLGITPSLLTIQPYDPANWERMNRLLFRSVSSFPNAAYNSMLYCAYGRPDG